MISGNTQQGIYVANSLNTSIRGNAIGVNSSGLAFGNGMDGINVQSSFDTNIGWNEPLGRNTIAYNGESGIDLQPINASIAGNSIFDNNGLGIDVKTSPAQEGVTPNDMNEADNIQNFPVLTGVSFPGAGLVRIEAKLATLPNEPIDIYFYGNDTCDPSGYGEGKVYLGKLSNTTDGSGQATFLFTLTLPRPLMFFTATAYSLTNGNSEFSACLSSSTYLPIIMK